MAGALGSFEEDAYGIKSQPLASTGLVALAGGGQTGATPLKGRTNEVATVATAADSVILPVSVPGTVLIVLNNAGANSMNVYAQVGDTINAIAANSPFAMAAAARVTFACVKTG